MQLITGSVSQLEQLLPQVAYGNLMAENLGSLTPAHFRQLLQLGQACLDYLHAICCATSKVLVSTRQLLMLLGFYVSLQAAGRLCSCAAAQAGSMQRKMANVTARVKTLLVCYGVVF
jgi:hypothetical protein